MSFRAAVIPAAPVYVDGVTRQRTQPEVRLRRAILDAITWAADGAASIGINSGQVPIVGLGPFGIDRGVEMRTGSLFVGQRWRSAADSVAYLDSLKKQHTLVDQVQAASVRAGSAALLAVEAGLRPVPMDLASAAVVSFDFSATSTPDGPLAPVDGASEHDDVVMDALKQGSAAALARAAEGSSTWASNVESVRRLLEVHGQPRVFVDYDAETLGTRTAVLRMEFT